MTRAIRFFLDPVKLLTVRRQGPMILRAMNPALLLAAAAALPGFAAPTLRWSCVDCEKHIRISTINLLARRDAAANVTVEWTSPVDPSNGGARTLMVYLGEPTKSDALERRALEFEPRGNEFVARVELPARELGKETCLVVITARPKGEAERKHGENEELLEWRAFRPRTLEQLEALAVPPPAGDARTLTVRPWLLAVHTSHGDLPRQEEGTERASWPLQGSQGAALGQDIDGENTGAPGLDIHVADPWTVGEGEDWKAQAERILGLQTPEKTRFQEWVPFPEPDHKTEIEALEGKAKTKLILRS